MLRQARINKEVLAPMANILVVDDELGIRDLLSEILNEEGYAVELAENAAEAREARQRGQPDLVLLDIWMPDTDGVTLLKEWRGAGLLTMPVIMMSGHATIETAVEATRIGARAFLEKPITLKKLLDTIEHALAGPAAPAAGGRARTKNNVTAVPAAPVPSSRLVVETAGVTMPELEADEPEPTRVFELDQPLREARDAFEKAYFEYHLAREGGSMTRVAERTGLERTHLYRKFKQLGIDLARSRRNAAGSADQDSD